MARIILGSYMVRYPLGGVLSSSLQWLVGFQQLGHDVYLVEKSGWADSCFDPLKNVMSDNCAYGTRTVNSLLARFGLQDKWCYVDAQGKYHGMSRELVMNVFKTADVFIDRGTHGAWLLEAQKTGLRVLIDGEPGATQMKMEKRLATGQRLPDYDYYFTVGRNIGTPASTIPTAGRQWIPLYHPVVAELFRGERPNADASITTVMNWRAHEPIEFNGKMYGQKDVEFDKFMSLPNRAQASLEIAIAGKAAPKTRLMKAGWQLRSAHEVTMSFDSYAEYVRASKAEFSVAKNVFVATNSGWFSDRSAAYLASGRPVVLQDTGFNAHLPCGQGLFAVRSVDEAAAAIDAIRNGYERHSRWAGEIAVEYLDAKTVLGRFLNKLIG